ncbi:MAG TPA: hypothetical protein DEF35_20515 [Paenibacillus sp.]|jgi:hypothetical protein|uniref:hypothetical protein n=1 Tax=Paenibacillus TaxID=44249 RepID=UPI000B9FA8D4|nr:MULTISPECIES: hypothetical protein [Paenibacillus]OZQ71904.1 hypothetical protein CA599_08590 [Paenibacillus taichungensis]HBU84002.1 hypothetical protein [Paenibacillus sp.]
MRNKKWFLVAAAVIVLSGAFYMNSISAESPTQLIQDQLVKEGVAISKITTQERNLKLETKSTSTSGEATIEDIKAIRKIRNEVRSGVNGTSQIKNIDLTITGKNGQNIYNGVSNDITQIPDFSSKIVGKLDSESVQNAIYSELKANGVSVESTEIMDNQLGGKLASIVLTTEIPEVNSLVPKIEQWITALNDSDGIGVSQYELTINDKSNHSTLLYLTTDLVYRDFYWWQSPALGDEVWTKTKPESQESAASKDKVPATIEEGIHAGPSGADNNGYEGPQFKK